MSKPFSSLLSRSLSVCCGALLCFGFVACTAYNPLEKNAGVNHRGEAEATNWLHNPQHWVDQTWRLIAAPKSADGEGHSVMANAKGLTLGGDALSRYPVVGFWVSPTVETDQAFTELLPSWNVNAPPETGLALEVRVRGLQNKAWSPWMRIGDWGRIENQRSGAVSFEGGRVEVDVLRLTQLAEAFEMKVTLQSHHADPAVSPTLRRLTVVTSGQSSAEALAAQAQDPRLPATAWARDLPVPFRTQQHNPAALRPRTCSPTSTSMVMAYRGVDKPITENALGIYDAEYGLFGNWGRAVAWASQHGLDAELVRLRDWQQVERYIAAGQPIIASIKFAPGTFPSNLMSSSAGHLIVVRGLTADGDAIVNDPAVAVKGRGAVYKKEELAAAWFRNGGVAYIIQSRSGAAPNP